MKNLKLETKSIIESSQNYCLDRKKSNQVLKGIKVVLFATGLSLLNPINVEAKETTKIEEIKELLDNPYLICAGSILGSALLALVPIRKYLQDYLKEDEMRDVELPDGSYIEKEDIKIICK